MKVIVVSSPGEVKDEAIIINALFEEGLEVFHLRKPDHSKNDVEELMGKINPVHHSKIALHQHHNIADSLGIRRLHFPETERKKLDEQQLNSIREKGYTLSTSIHKVSEIDLLPETFSYAFLGPVFESISKPGYKPQAEIVLRNENRKTGIVAIGGITPENLAEVVKLNFDGAALLGSVWSKTSNAVEIFKRCKRTVNM